MAAKTRAGTWFAKFSVSPSCWTEKDISPTFARQARNCEGLCRRFTFLQHKFPRMSLEKLKAGAFDGPQIRELMNDSVFDDSMSGTELSTWWALWSVIASFREKTGMQNT